VEGRKEKGARKNDPNMGRGRIWVWEISNQRRGRKEEDKQKEGKTSREVQMRKENLLTKRTDRWWTTHATCLDSERSAKNGQRSGGGKDDLKRSLTNKEKGAEIIA